MKTKLIIVDDFYEDPYELREFALKQNFHVIGNYPGVRTRNFMSDSAKSIIQTIIRPYSGEVTNWLDGPEGYTGSFQLTTCLDRSWIHSDDYNNWAGVLYLTPDAPIESGTGFFKSKIDGSYGGFDHSNLPGADMSKWEKISDVGNVFNRLVLFAADQWHSSLTYFGDDYQSGRLTQVFFFHTER